VKITESRLKQIIREEIELRIIKKTINEVIEEMQLSLTEEQRLLLEKSVLDQIKSAAKKYAVPAAVVAALAFGSQIGNDLQILDGVGATPAAAEQIQNVIDASQNMSDARSDFLQGAIDDSGREGEIPADLAKGVGADDAKDIAMDRLEAEFASKGDIESTGQAQQTADGASYITYVPYDSLPDGFKDTFTRGAEKEDLKQYYQTMDIQDLADLVKDFNKWGSEGQGNFYDSESTGTQLLPSSWSIAYKALQDKAADRAAKGKNTFKETLDNAVQQ
jgi:hypothetical protein|tara:strand:- start:927 stop:1754 length:828 start_codon:yes stop_codon:yes gene_type:complete